MRRPAWAAAGTFSNAWAAIESGRGLMPSSPACPPTMRQFLLKGLSLAHVLTVPRDQVEAIPHFDTYTLAAEVGAQVRLPFDPLYLSTDCAQAYGYVPGMGHIGGVLMSRAVAGQWTNLPEHSLLCIPFVCFAARREQLFISGVAAADESLVGFGAVSLLPDDHAAAEESKVTAADGADMAIKILSWLESINVDLVEAPLSPKQKERELRKGRKLALTVQVRSPKRKSVSRNGKANYSHRFEVAGHYMHFPEGTRLGDSDPSKLSFVPGRGFVRKVWCPPHVKGPEDKPLVPKVRIVDHDRETRV